MWEYIDANFAKIPCSDRDYLTKRGQADGCKKAENNSDNRTGRRDGGGEPPL
jgi:hypothetical protein